jgi:hypothetical protein
MAQPRVTFAQRIYHGRGFKYRFSPVFTSLVALARIEAIFLDTRESTPWLAGFNFEDNNDHHAAPLLS